MIFRFLYTLPCGRTVEYYCIVLLLFYSLFINKKSNALHECKALLLCRAALLSYEDKVLSS